MADLSDPVEVRPEDDFDIDAVAGWLVGVDAALAQTPTVLQFPGGASNLTYELVYPDRRLIMRRPPVGAKAKSAHDMRREYTIQSRLADSYPHVAAMVALCQDETVIGSDFYVMEKLEGLILRKDLPPGQVWDPELAREVCVSVIDGLVELHRVDVSAAGLADLSRGEGYVGRQVVGWSDRFRLAVTPDAPSFEPAMEWLAAHQPADVAQCVIHNDYRLDNLVLDGVDPRRIRGVLDWEMATVGDPLMDLGGALAYWVQADDDPVNVGLRRQPTHLPGMLTRQEVIDYYADRTGFAIDNWRFYQAFGLFRLAVIAQQIYYRYYHGQTRNPVFKEFHHLVNYLEQRCLGVISENLR